MFVYEGGWRISSYYKAIRTLHRYLKTRRYDVISARFGQCGVVARAQWRVPVVLMYGGSDIEGSPQFSGIHRYRHYVLRTVSWILSLLVDEVIVVSEHLGRKLPRRSYHVINSGVDRSLFRPMVQAECRRKLGIGTTKRLALFAGDPRNRRKRHELAVEACRLASTTVDLELVVLTGEPIASVPVYMNACDVLLLTSTNEGSPNVVREALACNLPIVSVNVGDVRERLDGVEGCRVCSDEAVETIARDLVEVVGPRQRLSPLDPHIGADTTQMADQLVRVYRKAVAAS